MGQAAGRTLMGLWTAWLACTASATLISCSALHAAAGKLRPRVTLLACPKHVCMDAAVYVRQCRLGRCCAGSHGCGCPTCAAGLDLFDEEATAGKAKKGGKKQKVEMAQVNL